MTLLISPRSGNVGDLLDPLQSPPALLEVVDSSSLTPPALTSDDIENTSDAPGDTVSDALNGIGGGLATLQGEFETLAADTAGTGLHATGVNPQQLTTRIRPRLVQIADYFIGGSTVSGSIGQLGWTLGTGIGTPSVNRLSSGNFGTAVSSRLAVQASTALNDRTSMMLSVGESGATSALMRPQDLNILQTCLSVPLTSRRIFFGLSDTFNQAPTAMTNALGFIYDSGVSPNWQIITRAASVGAAVITAAVVPSVVAELLSIVRIADDNYAFWIGNTLVGSILAGVADTTNMNVGYQVTSLSAGPGSQVNVGYFGLQATGSGALAADTFLQG
jgi:hypothetical protein